MKKIASNIINLRTKYRRIVLISLDFWLIFFSILFGLWLTSNESFQEDLQRSKWILSLTPFIGTTFYFLTSNYKALTKYVGSRSFYKLSIYNLFIILVIRLIGFLGNFEIPKLTSFIIFWFLITFSTITTKIILRDILLSINLDSRKKNCSNRVAIYGAGAAGAQLSNHLLIDSRFSIKTFIDDNPDLWNRTLKGISINSPEFLKNKKKQIDQILIAIPTISKSRLREIVEKLKNEGYNIMQIPSIDELASGKVKIDNIKPIVIEDLLGRDAIPANKEFLAPLIVNNVVCITGAGGSIGGQLSKDIAKLKPKKLILVENNEPSLYKIQENIRNDINEETNLISILGDLQNYKLIQNIFESEKVNIVFHTAAYKHVPIVENNPLMGISNNVKSTRNICEAAFNCESIQNVLLVSTDKAVRPTNIMGASKRIAEIIFKTYALMEDKKKNIKNKKFSMVRFGNVLGSSGSVIPLFKEQISKGLPITITDERIIRYFMTLEEASYLLIKSLDIAKGGDIFLLDMGKPVKIKDLAIQMIKLSGLKLKDKENPNGDIEIKIIGLRDGEKLYEELLVDGKSIPTEHPLIFRAEEKLSNNTELFENLNDLEEKINNFELYEALKIIKILVPEWISKKYQPK